MEEVDDVAYVFAIESEVKFISSATFRQDKNAVWVINGVWTDPVFRQQGLSKEIFTRIFETAKEMEIDRIELGVNPELTSALDMYESLGFELADSCKKCMGDGKMYPNNIMRIYLKCCVRGPLTQWLFRSFNNFYKLFWAF